MRRRLLLGVLLAAGTSACVAGRQPPPPAATVHGVVRARDGQPVPQAVVVVVDSTEYRTDGDWLVLTDSLGRYTVTLPPGHHRLAIGFSSAAEWRDTLQLAAGEQRQHDVVLDMVAPGWVAGSVRDTTGRPVRKAMVFLVGTARNAETDSAGRYRVLSMPGVFALRVARLGYHPRQLDSVPIASAATITRDVVLLPCDSTPCLRR